MHRTQMDAPIVDALEKMRAMRLVPLDVPGHKRGRGNPELMALLGERCLSLDVNSMKPLDNLCHPVSVIREAEQLAAEAFQAAHAFLMVGGTTSSVESMILYALRKGDKVILPRNVHRSVINALVLCGGEPVYVSPEIDEGLGIPLGMRLSGVEDAIRRQPDARAVLLNNPTYYGICSDRSPGSPATAACCRWRTRPTAPTSTSERGCPFRRWRRVSTFQRSACTSPAAA